MRDASESSDIIEPRAASRSLARSSSRSLLGACASRSRPELGPIQRAAPSAGDDAGADDAGGDGEESTHPPATPLRPGDGGATPSWRPRRGRAQIWTVMVGANGTHNFAPSTLTIRAGDTVHWVWQQSGHTVTSGAGGTPTGSSARRATRDAADAQTSGTGATYDHVFAAPGHVSVLLPPHATRDGRLDRRAVSARGHCAMNVSGTSARTRPVSTLGTCRPRAAAAMHAPERAGQRAREARVDDDALLVGLHVQRADPSNGARHARQRVAITGASRVPPSLPTAAVHVGGGRAHDAWSRSPSATRADSTTNGGGGGGGRRGGGRGRRRRRGWRGLRDGGSGATPRATARARRARSAFPRVGRPCRVERSSIGGTLSSSPSPGLAPPAPGPGGGTTASEPRRSARTPEAVRRATPASGHAGPSRRRPSPRARARRAPAHTRARDRRLRAPPVSSDAAVRVSDARAPVTGLGSGRRPRSRSAPAGPERMRSAGAPRRRAVRTARAPRRAPRRRGTGRPGPCAGSASRRRASSGGMSGRTSSGRARLVLQRRRADVDGRVAVEGQHARGQLVEAHAERPDVGCARRRRATRASAPGSCTAASRRRRSCP